MKKYERLGNFYSHDNLGAGVVLLPLAIFLLVVFSVYVIYMPDPPIVIHNNMGLVLSFVWLASLSLVLKISWLTRK